MQVDPEAHIQLYKVYGAIYSLMTIINFPRSCHVSIPNNNDVIIAFPLNILPEKLPGRHWLEPVFFLQLMLAADSEVNLLRQMVTDPQVARELRPRYHVSVLWETSPISCTVKAVLKICHCLKK
jgi:hypothetical protein